jgi:metal-responsive CopG/Arc/MetJ family transcriptional regulator
MRMHIEMDDDLVERVDAVAGPKGRSAFVREAVRVALDQHQRWQLLRSARGALAGRSHAWDADPAAWTRKQRRGDRRRLG